MNEPDELAERLAAVPRRGRKRRKAVVVAEPESIASLAPASVEVASDPIEAFAAPADADESSADPELDLFDVEAIAATSILEEVEQLAPLSKERRRLKRLPRSHFRRGEGWRARLPAVVHLGRKAQQQP